MGLKRGLNNRSSREVGGDAGARAGTQVGEVASTGVEVQVQSMDGTSGQGNGVGFDEVGLLTKLFVFGPSSSGLGQCLRGSRWVVGTRLAGSSEGEAQKVNEALKVGLVVGTSCHKGLGSLTGPSISGLSSSGLGPRLVGSKWTAGPSPAGPPEGEAQKVFEALKAGPGVGPSCLKGLGWATVELHGSFGPSTPLRDRHVSPQSQPFVLKARPPALCVSCMDCNLEMEFFKTCEKEIWRKQHSDTYRTMTDNALEEEALRYGFVQNSGGLRALGSSSLISFFFGRAPEGEFYDRSGALREGVQEVIPLRNTVVDGNVEKGNSCWDLVEVNNADLL